MDKIVEQNKNLDLSFSILARLEADSSDQVFLKLQRMSPPKRQIIFNNLDGVDFNLTMEVNRFLKKLFGHLPDNLLDRWLIIGIIAYSDIDYRNNTEQILAAISTVINKKLKITHQIDWSKLSLEAEKYLRALDNLYEIKAFSDIEDASFYLNHFYQNFTSKAEIEDIYKNNLKLFREMMGSPPTLEEVKNYNQEVFLKKLAEEIGPNPKIVNPSLIRATISSWRLIPEIELNRLLNPGSHNELIGKLIAAIRALRIVRQSYTTANQKIADFNILISWLRESIKQSLRLFDFTSWQDENEAKAIVGQLLSNYYR